MIPTWFQAILWGWVVGAALLIGATTGYATRVPSRIIAVISAFGAGVLIALLTFNLLDEAYQRGGFEAAVLGFLAGSLIYSGANWYLARYGAKYRKQSGFQQLTTRNVAGSGLAIAIGSLLDDIPESIIVGLSMIGTGTVSLVVVIGIFMSNIPEGLSSAAGMKNANRPASYVFGIWGSIAFITGLSSYVGYSAFSHLPPDILAATLALAAGAILNMLADTMLPEAFAEVHNLSGFMTVIGFIVFFVLAKLAA